jgi:transposase
MRCPKVLSNCCTGASSRYYLRITEQKIKEISIDLWQGYKNLVAELIPNV